MPVLVRGGSILPGPQNFARHSGQPRRRALAENPETAHCRGSRVDEDAERPGSGAEGQASGRINLEGCAHHHEHVCHGDNFLRRGHERHVLAEPNDVRTQLRTLLAKVAFLQFHPFIG